MHDHDPSNEYQPPFGIAGFACFICWVFMLFVARPAVALLDVWWAEGLVDAAFPLSVCFVILYGSHWHREMRSLARAFYLILVSGIISGCALFCGGAVILGFFVVVNRFTAFHY